MSVILIPQGVTRVQVKDEVGKTIWRKPNDVRPTDKIQFNPATGEAYTMYGSPGVSVPNLPINTPQAAISRIKSKKQDALVKDQVYNTTKTNPDSSDVLTSVLVGLAEESASLAFERQEAERKGESTSQISLRRVNALKAVGDTWLKKKEILIHSSLDLDSPTFKVVFIQIAETFRKACDDAGVRAEMCESIFSVFGEIVDDEAWLKELKRKIDKGDL